MMIGESGSIVSRKKTLLLTGKDFMIPNETLDEVDIVGCDNGIGRKEFIKMKNNIIGEGDLIHRFLGFV